MVRAWCRVLLPLLGGVAVLWAWPAHAKLVQPSVIESGSVIVTAETAEVREGPSPGFDVITVVEKGEIFLKAGRTGAWYYILINNDAFGWISGRAISRYQADGLPSPYVGPYDDRYYPYYPGGYYYYPYYYWGQPYLSWEWYVYDREWHRDRSWDHDRHRDDELHGGRNRSWDDGRSRDEDWHRGNDSHRNDDTRHRSNPQTRPSTPRFRPPLRRR